MKGAVVKGEIRGQVWSPYNLTGGVIKEKEKEERLIHMMDKILHTRITSANHLSTTCTAGMERKQEGEENTKSKMMDEKKYFIRRMVAEQEKREWEQ